MTRRSIFISGASQGLGFETAVQLLAKPGILLFLGSLELDAGHSALGKIVVNKSSRGVVVQLDVTDQLSVNTAADEVSQVLKDDDLPGLDVLINNAGIGLGPGFTFEKVFRVNVAGTASVKAAFRPLLSSSGASIINISSRIGSISQYATAKDRPISPEYASSKAAINALTAIWAYEEREKGSNVRVIAVCPGHNATNLNNFGAMRPGAADPREGCKIIVEAAMEERGPSGVFYNKDGSIPW